MSSDAARTFDSVEGPSPSSRASTRAPCAKLPVLAAR